MKRGSSHCPLRLLTGSPSMPHEPSRVVSRRGICLHVVQHGGVSCIDPEYQKGGQSITKPRPIPRDSGIQGQASVPSPPDCHWCWEQAIQADRHEQDSARRSQRQGDSGTQRYDQGAHSHDQGASSLYPKIPGRLPATKTHQSQPSWLNGHATMQMLRPKGNPPRDKSRKNAVNPVPTRWSKRTLLSKYLANLEMQVCHCNQRME